MEDQQPTAARRKTTANEWSQKIEKKTKNKKKRKKQKPVSIAFVFSYELFPNAERKRGKMSPLWPTLRGIIATTTALFFHIFFYDEQSKRHTHITKSCTTTKTTRFLPFLVSFCLSDGDRHQTAWLQFNIDTISLLVKKKKKGTSRREKPLVSSRQTEVVNWPRDAWINSSS